MYRGVGVDSAVVHPGSLAAWVAGQCRAARLSSVRLALLAGRDIGDVGRDTRLGQVSFELVGVFGLVDLHPSLGGSSSAFPITPAIWPSTAPSRMSSRRSRSGYSRALGGFRPSSPLVAMKPR